MRKHIGDPCIFCDTPHDKVLPGECPGGNILIRGKPYKEIVITDEHGFVIASISDQDVVLGDGYESHFLAKAGSYQDIGNGLIKLLPMAD